MNKVSQNILDLSVILGHLEMALMLAVRTHSLLTKTHILEELSDQINTGTLEYDDTIS